MRVGQCQRQGIRRIGCRWFGQIQHALDHFRNGLLLRSAITDDRLLHLAGGDLVDVHPAFARRHQGRTACLAHHDRGLQVLREEDAFHRAHFGFGLLDHLPQLSRDVNQTTRMFPVGGTLEGALGQGLGVGIRARSTQGRVDAEDDRSLETAGAFADLVRRFAPTLPGLFLQGCELLRRNGHRARA